MVRRRIKNTIAAGLVMLGLFVSAVSACACSHHRANEDKEAQLSCHSQSHEETETNAAANDGSPKIDDQCSCYVRNFESAIITKSESKKSKAERSDLAHSGNASEVEFSVSNDSETTALVFAAGQFYLRHLPRSGPSRAPPRL